MKPKFFIFFLALFAICGTYAANYTATTAAEITTRFGQLQAGDTLFIASGVYHFSTKVSISRAGTAANRIVICAQDISDRPIFDFSTQPYNSSNRGVSVSQSANYLHILGLVIRYAGDNGLYVDGSHNIIERCEFYGNCDTGLQLKNGCDNLIKNCDSHHNFDYQTGGTSSPDWGGNADGFADKQYTNIGEPNVFEGCRSWANSDDGWDFYQKVGNSIIRNSICYQNGQRTYDMTNHPRRLGIDAAWFNALPNVAAVRNYGNGNGFKLGGLNTQHQVTVTNCLAVANNVKGFDQNNNYGTMTLYNNSAYNNGTDYGFNNANGGTLIIKNSLSLATKSANVFKCKTVTTDHNSWNISGLTCTAADFASLDTTVLISPRQPNGDLPVLPFMRLVQGSALIDAGVNVGLAYTGAAPDLGCYEFETPSSVKNSEIDANKLKTNFITDFIELNETDKISSVKIYSLTGQLCFSAKPVESKINVSQLNSGYYIVRVNEIFTEKILKK